MSLIVVDGLGEHCVGALCQWCHHRFLLSFGILCIDGLEIIPCLVHVSLGCFH